MKTKIDAQINNHCNAILDELKHLHLQLKFHMIKKYLSHDLAEILTKLKDSLGT